MKRAKSAAGRESGDGDERVGVREGSPAHKVSPHDAVKLAAGTVLPGEEAVFSDEEKLQYGAMLSRLVGWSHD